MSRAFVFCLLLLVAGKAAAGTQKYEPLAASVQAAMIFTVDAGIYVREWSIGLRIEDNVLVTADECENLSAEIPSTIEEIENLMADKA